MSWLDGSAPVFLAGGGGPAIRYEYLLPVERAPERFEGDGHAAHVIQPRRREPRLAGFEPRPKKPCGRTPKPIEPRVCAWEPCGVVFTPKVKRGSRYHSKACGTAASHARGDRTPEGGTIAERARLAGIAPSLVYLRVFHGWTLERALTTPVQTTRRSPKSNFGGWR